MHPVRPDSPPRRPRPVLALTTALALSCVLLLVLVAMRWSPLMRLDRDIVRSLHGRALAEPGVTQVNRVLTDWVWDPWTMRLLCAVIVLVLVWRLRGWLLAGWVAATCLVGSLLQQGLKAAVDRPRPVWRDPVDSAHYAAFPSGHAMTATVVCALVLWLLRRYGAGRTLWRSALALAVVSVLGVGLTRLWLGVHWPSDVLAGWLLGALTVTLSTAAYGKWVAPNARA
ncbi:phosphatase PAP2 family protein [Streptomyces sp. NBC_01016]|uniref:phosphatase PAP2 family protein n=1 Tax=Streptomyces sp. NBC_01016 TaxID=2903720 RepID=UPI002255BC80|nr:phosphatase PAP2 family protein [Streptomyces sp. NBC_01016]MCX4830909.1 phosphatase PAP2 family protein [Streptomyces sp. NBC_01016]